MPNFTIRPARPSDAEALLAIYAPYVEKTAITFEYDVPSAQEFRGRIEETLKAYPYLVAELQGRPVGYAYASPFHTRAAYDWNVETSIYVEEGQKRNGIGRALYDALEKYLHAMGIVTLYACITYPESPDPYVTTASVDFHSYLGYQMVGNFHQSGYKFNRWYDVVWMEKQIGHRVVPMPAVKRFAEVISSR